MKKTLICLFVVTYSLTGFAKTLHLSSANIVPDTKTKSNNRVIVGQGTISVPSGKPNNPVSVATTQYCNPKVYRPTVSVSVAAMGYQSIPDGQKRYFRACYMGSADVAISNTQFSGNDISFIANVSSKSADVFDSKKACIRLFGICFGHHAQAAELKCADLQMPVTLNYTASCVPK